MSKTLILAALVAGFVAIIEARPSYIPTSALLPTAYEHHLEYAPTIVGHTAYSLPTAVSHQSQTIIHEKRPYLRPIIEHTPILRTAAHPVHVLDAAYLPTTAAIGIPATPTLYASGLGTYASLYGGGWSAGSLSPWIK